MSAIYHWIVGAVTNTTNSAAESILRRIIKRFLEEPFQENLLSLKLFEDWTLHLSLSKVFLNCNMVNSYVPILIFRSIYISKFKFDVSYNLSKFNIEIAMTVIEIESKEKDPFQNDFLPDQELTESIHNFHDQLPIEKEQKFTDWILNCIKEVKLNINDLTCILHIGEEFENLSMIIEKMNCSYAKDIVSLNLSSFKFVIGEKRNKKDIASIVDFKANINMKDRKIKSNI